MYTYIKFDIWETVWTKVINSSSSSSSSSVGPEWDLEDSTPGTPTTTSSRNHKKKMKKKEEKTVLVQSTLDII